MASEMMRIAAVQSIAAERPQTVGPGRTDRAEVAVPKAPEAPEIPDISNVIRELQQVSLAFNRRLQFRVNEDLGMVIVKVIDSRTDEVIKEIPPEQLQRLHGRIREAIGLIVDERI